MSDMILYNYFRSSTSYRVRIALNWKKLKYEYIPIHLLKDGGEQHSAQYRGINPSGGVPTLVHKGATISQSSAIIEYLDSVFPEQPLFPTSPVARAKVRQFCDNINCEMHPLQNLRVLQKLEKNFGADQQTKEHWVSDWCTDGFAALEKMLQQSAGHYCFGDQITAADLYLVPQVFSAIRFNVNMSPFPLVMKVNETCLKLDEFAHAHPFVQIDTPAELRKG